ncbi:amidohydrolase family protein [Rhodococcus opacus]|uniref:amidohydrolase family protein n=1 Tax=Rhodococcus opacus TaxID=37919 RepID=UPI0035B1D5C1
MDGRDRRRTQQHGGFRRIAAQRGCSAQRRHSRAGRDRRQHRTRRPHPSRTWDELAPRTRTARRRRHDALRAATSRTADAFDLPDRGRIRPGLRADLLLVDGDPTSTITATRCIRAVYVAGTPVRLPSTPQERR